MFVVVSGGVIGVGVGMVVVGVAAAVVVVAVAVVFAVVDSTFVSVGVGRGVGVVTVAVTVNAVAVVTVFSWWWCYCSCCGVRRDPWLKSLSTSFVLLCQGGLTALRSSTNLARRANACPCTFVAEKGYCFRSHCCLSPTSMCVRTA